MSTCYIKLFIYFWILTERSTSMSWMRVYSLSSVIASEDPCRELGGLSNKQRSMCKRHDDLLAPILRSANLSLGACQLQFQNEKWNCSVARDSNYLIGPIQETATKEAAFITATISSSLVYSVTKACSSSAVKSCRCDRNPVYTKDNGAVVFQQGGCSDNVRYASRFVRRFLSASENLAVDALPVRVVIHNSNAGRKITEKSKYKACRCHGVSGTCTLRSCWRVLPSFHNISSVLKYRYSKAVHLNKAKMSRIIRSNSWSKRLRAPRDQLVYLDPSPSFCVRNETMGLLGTENRQCHIKGDSGKCSELCCNRGYKVQMSTRKKNCRCKFIYCCRVECDSCTIVEEHAVCK